MRLIKTQNEIVKLKTNKKAKEFLKDNKIELEKHILKIDNPVFVHFEFDDFKPWYLPKNESEFFK